MNARIIIFLLLGMQLLGWLCVLFFGLCGSSFLSVVCSSLVCHFLVYSRRCLLFLEELALRMGANIFRGLLVCLGILLVRLLGLEFCSWFWRILEWLLVSFFISRWVLLPLKLTLL